MKKIIPAVLLSTLMVPVYLQAANTGFLEGEAQEVIVKVRSADGKVKWYKVREDGSRTEMDMKPGDRFEFLYEESVDLDAITVKPQEE
ncbi:MAG: hypothetical protein P8166_01670 [Candidatus Thiodiazotropha sp.]